MSQNASAAILRIQAPSKMSPESDSKNQMLEVSNGRTTLEYEQECV